MKRLVYCLGLLATALTVAMQAISCSAQAPGNELPAPGQEKKKEHIGPKAVLIGDSITWQWARASRRDSRSNIVIPLDPLPSYMTEDGEDYVITKFHPEFFPTNNYINKGISGENTTQILARFKADVVDLDPKCVVIMAGTNDLAQGYGRSTIMKNLGEMAQMAHKAGIKVILCSVTPCNQSYSKLDNPKTKGAHILLLNKEIKEYAQNNNFVYCDYYPYLVGEDGLELKLEYCLYDRLHPNPDAYTIMEGVIKPIIDSVL